MASFPKQCFGCILLLQNFTYSYNDVARQVTFYNLFYEFFFKLFTIMQQEA